MAGLDNDQGSKGRALGMFYMNIRLETFLCNRQYQTAFSHGVEEPGRLKLYS